ncbi:conjugal transfer pilus assembly protein TraU, partial [Pantoea dispersa]|uniref:conjugal transfer pilus assembly protein TraU n=1 Tax=Pantoea dispersa TaxID=59814 RepID=UPI0021F75411
GFKIDLGRTGTGRGGQSDAPTPGSFYHVHWYKYPLIFWLNIITSEGCMQTGDMDIAYLSEVDPLWNDSTLAMILNPEVALFSNLLAQGACAADSIASAAGMPLDPLFWCAGAQGSMYPFTGYTSNEFSPLEASLLVSERMAFKLHREGLVMETVGADVAVCYEYPSPIIPKSRWRYQMVNMYPEPSDCHPFGTTTQLWGSTHNTPASKKNFGYLMWRKRNCVYL